MIYTRLHGGMGNQLFQYAAGRALAARLGVDLCVDDRILADKGLRNCAQHFAWNHRTSQTLPPSKRESLLRYGLWRAFGLSPKLRREQGLGFNLAFETWGDDSYLHGYWQSERYFAPIADQLRDELVIQTAPSADNARMAERIQASPSVSLHVRRGDYLQIAAHQVCGEAYYQRAIVELAETAGIEPEVFVFSNDPDWARDHLPLPFKKTVVDLNGAETDYEDLRLMSLCQHNVIANSSFSWWGAWLNANPGKVVAAPSRWFGVPDLSNPDIWPEGWLKIAA